MNIWIDKLDGRQRKEVEFARAYAADFAHGTDGHNRLLLIAKLAELLDEGYGMPVAVKPPRTDPNVPIAGEKPATMA